MNISKAVEVVLADEAPKIINGYWHEWIDGEWVNTGVKAEGKGIFKITDYYGVSTHKDVLPSKWELEIPIKLSNEYLWNYEEITYTDGSYVSTKKRIIQGKDARSVQSVKNAYAFSSSDTKAPISGWMSTIASLGVKPEGYFLWVRDDITYSDGTSSSTVGYVVKDGKDSVSIGLTNNPIILKINKQGNVVSYTHAKGKIGVFKGNIEIDSGSLIYENAQSHNCVLQTDRWGNYEVASITKGAEDIYSDLRVTYQGVTYVKRLNINTVKDGDQGLPGQGLPGQIPVQKEWIVGDVHRNTDEIIDFLYVRGKDNNTSYWYKKKYKGTTIAGTPPQNGIVPDDYEVVSWLNELAVKILIAEEANIANFIFKDEKLLSLKGKTFAGLDILYGNYTEYEFTDRTSVPSENSAYWTNLPSSIIRFVRFKKNTETSWTVKTIGTYGGRWTVQFANNPDSTNWYNSYNIGRSWMRIKEAGTDINFREAVKIDLSTGIDFTPNILIDGARGTMKITGEINATSGNVAGLIIEQNKLLSRNRRVEIDGKNNIIALKDESLNVRTIIHPNDIESIESYFDTGGSYNADLSYLNSDNFTGTDIVSLTIGGSSSETHELTITGFDIETYLSVYLGGGDPDSIAEAATIVELLKDGVVMLRLAEAIATSYADTGGATAYGGMQSRTFAVAGNSTYTLWVSHSLQQPQGGATATSFAKISGMTTMTTGKVVNRSEIGNNGMVIATSSLNYTYDVGSLFQVRRGNIGFQVTSNGVKKSNNMYSSNPIWTDV